ncbi:DUF2946 domain-containing protein [Rosenbergiella collisarenosi]|uniref:DUF2946 domain-containing protein n=1 Tax=Rosenbergiella collisarenosi TaxID=1544695 RepID=UPI001F4DD5AB|nr:DUF2946 domain-containing protein [Rosenbergiella collisarenosi]
MTRYPYWQRWAAWLAMFSIAMLFVAPIISKTLAHPSSSLATMAMPSMDDECGMAMPHAAKIDNTLLDDMACGYCQLLAHFPFIQLFVVILLSQRYVPLVRRRLTRYLGADRPGFWSPRLTRAPPPL